MAHRCSFPGCDEVTAGPGQEDASKVVIVGEAAHIHAASPGGPRFNPDMNAEQCSSIENGIWMCRKHARIIDVDDASYSATTLQQWKAMAEQRAFEQLNGSSFAQPYLPEVLIRLSRRIVFWGHWLRIEQFQWCFRVGKFVEGDVQLLQEFCMNFLQLPDYERFVIVESQGDGRELEGISWTLERENAIVLDCLTRAKAPRTDYNFLSDIALDDEGDPRFADGDFDTVMGIEAAIQAISAVLSTDYGDYPSEPWLGSDFSQLIHQYQHSPLLNPIIKMEVARLLTVGAVGRENALVPPLDFIHIVLDVQVLGVRQLPICHPATLYISLQFGTGEYWKGTITIPIRGSN
ncbi:hypothetical protein HB364_14015 [Pseudoflavitalea sp. X16]|uniref:hypothetical protein n=1 Tax=Paraflavitalea devenefica TaxID=2716334 RepID=UPI00142471C1|nr:hypothetical protein [Paraflavitalea devenefica]NII26205.1 hypothetical protein [Paraflavitalea devenefica]